MLPMMTFSRTSTLTEGQGRAGLSTERMTATGRGFECDSCRTWVHYTSSDEDQDTEWMLLLSAVAFCVIVIIMTIILIVIVIMRM